MTTYHSPLSVFIINKTLLKVPKQKVAKFGFLLLLLSSDGLVQLSHEGLAQNGNILL